MLQLKPRKDLISVCFALLGALVVTGCMATSNNGPQIESPNPNVPPTQTEIVIEDDHKTTWMPMNNWFSNNVNGWDPNDIHWKGILIQLGSYKGMQSAFKVELYEDPSAQPAKVLTAGTFQRWVDVMAVNAGGQPHHVRKEDHPEDLADAMTNALACYLAPSLQGCPPTSDCRSKSLHVEFTPERVLTYWPGPNGYEVTAQAKPASRRHMRYTFKLKDKVKVRIDGVDYSTPGAIKKIVIDHAGPGAAHKDTEDPPWPVP